VFLSSTFRDMHAEREELLKRVFPQLRKLCEQRGVNWGEVDLRWGITDEQKAEGRVLPVCLAEIDRSRPFFIGLLGDRYGWVPDDVPAPLLEQYPWLANARGCSVTELEVMHGALNDPGQALAYFYFRAPSTGHIDETEEPQSHRPKLAALKERIRTSGYAVRADYPDARTLGQWILTDFTALLNRLFPEETQPDPLTRETMEHEMFAAGRARAYLPREADFHRLDKHAQSEGLPLVIVGESGVGKSALLANWAIRFRERSGQGAAVPLLLHFIGATPASTDWSRMLQRLIGEVCRRFQLELPIPQESEALKTAFARCLDQAGARGRLVLVVDNLNQLENHQGAAELAWLPRVIPPQVRLILSALPGPALDELTRRGWPTFAARPMEPDERTQFVTTYLAEHAKALSPAQVERVVSARPTGNPLYLSVLLEELRLHGDHFTLDERINHYLEAETTDELYARILDRYEQDFEAERPGLVREAFTLLWAARRGLSEAELLQLLGKDSEPLPQAHWSPLYLAVERALISRGGVLGFADDHLRESVARKFLPAEENRRTAHLRLALYFADRFAADLVESGIASRGIDEVLWQDWKAKDYGRLHYLLANPCFLSLAWIESSLDVRAYWADLEQHTPYRMTETYRPVLDNPGQYNVSELLSVAQLLVQAGHPAGAQSLWNHLAKEGQKQKAGVRAAAQTAEALSLHQMGQSDEALALLREAEAAFRQEGDRIGLADALANQAMIHTTRGDLERAAAHCDEHEQLARELDAPSIRATSLGLRGSLKSARREWDQALLLLKEAERLFREIGTKDSLARCLGDQAGILQQAGDLVAAMSLHEQEEQLFRELGDARGLVTALNNRALLCDAQGGRPLALSLLAEAETLCRARGFKRMLPGCLTNRGVVLHSSGHREKAEAVLREARELGGEVGLGDLVAQLLLNQAVLLWTHGDRAGAKSLLARAEQSACTSPDPLHLARVLAFRAKMAEEEGSARDALTDLDQTEAIYRKMGNKAGLAECLRQRVIVLRNVEAKQEQTERLAELVRLQRELGEREQLAGALVEYASLLAEQGDLPGALTQYRTAAQLATELGQQAVLTASLLGQTIVLRKQGELVPALTVAQELETVCRKLDDRHRLLLCLGEQGEILYAQHKMDEALARYCEAEQLSRTLGDQQALQARLGDHAELLILQGEPDRALPLLEEMASVGLAIGNKSGWGLAQMLRTSALQQQGRLEEALAVSRAVVAGLRDADDPNALGTALFSLAALLAHRGETDEASILITEAETLFEAAKNLKKLATRRSLRATLVPPPGRLLPREQEINDLSARAIAAAREAHARYEQSDLEAARQLGEIEVNAWRKLGSNEALAGGLGFLGAVLHEQGELQGAMQCFTEKELLARELGYRKGVLACLNSRANIFVAWGDLSDALALSVEQEQLSAELDNDESLTDAVRRQVDILLQQGKHMEAFTASARGIGERAILFRRRGDLQQALADFSAVADLYKEADHRNGLCWALFNQAAVLKEQGDLTAAVKASSELERVVRAATSTGELVDGLVQLAVLQAEILGRPRQAFVVLEEAERLCTYQQKGEVVDRIRNMLAYLRSILH
jgi:tetratricopeptide (TPR) repeat protein